MGRLTVFFAMGGYAAYVWPAFGVVTLGMVGLLAETLIARRRARADIARLEAGGAPPGDAA
jgi:heme exporter protein D